jgi:hypothetical protein
VKWKSKIFFWGIAVSGTPFFFGGTTFKKKCNILFWTMAIDCIYVKGNSKMVVIRSQLRNLLMGTIELEATKVITFMVKVCTK